MKPSEQFEKIAEKAIAEAERVDCGFSMFVDGLKDIEATIRDRRHMAENELKAKEQDDA